MATHARILAWRISRTEEPGRLQSIDVRFQGKPFNITVIQAYAPTSNAKEAEVERFYEDLQDLLELTPQKITFSLSVRSVQSLSHVRFFATP